MAGLLSLWHLHHRPSYQHIIHKFMLWNIQFRHPYNQDNTSYSFLLLLQPLLKVFVKWQSHDRASKVPWSQSPFSSATSTHSQKESCQARELLKETDDYKVLQAFIQGGQYTERGKINLKLRETWMTLNHVVGSKRCARNLKILLWKEIWLHLFVKVLVQVLSMLLYFYFCYFIVKGGHT